MSILVSGGAGYIGSHMTAHSLEQIQGADQVVGVVLQGLGHALAHGLEARGPAGEAPRVRRRLPHPRRHGLPDCHL